MAGEQYPLIALIQGPGVDIPLDQKDSAGRRKYSKVTVAGRRIQVRRGLGAIQHLGFQAFLFQPTRASCRRSFRSGPMGSLLARRNASITCFRSGDGTFSIGDAIQDREHDDYCGLLPAVCSSSHSKDPTIVNCAVAQRIWPPPPPIDGRNGMGHGRFG
jgi:hypothetical protein